MCQMPRSMPLTTSRAQVSHTPPCQYPCTGFVCHPHEHQYHGCACPVQHPNNNCMTSCPLQVTLLMGLTVLTCMWCVTHHYTTCCTCTSASSGLHPGVPRATRQLAHLGQRGMQRSRSLSRHLLRFLYPLGLSSSARAVVRYGWRTAMHWATKHSTWQPIKQPKQKLLQSHMC